MKELVLTNILTPIDFSEVSLNALETAATLAKKHSSSLTVIHVIENTNFLYTPGGGLSAIALLPELLNTANEKLAEVALRVRQHHKVTVRTAVLSGHPVEAICQEAHRQNADLIILGSHGRNDFKDRLIGTTAYYVVKPAPVPVLTIPGERKWLDFRKILFPVRENSNSFDKYEFVKPIIRKEGSSVLLAGIINRNDPNGHLQVENTVEDIYNQLLKDEVVCGAQFYECKNQAQQVLEIAESEKPDMIVISTTTESSIWDLFATPFSKNVVDNSRFPVLSIRPRLEIETQIKAARYVDDRLGNPKLAFG